MFEDVFRRFDTSDGENIRTLKSRLGVTQDHWSGTIR